MGRGDRVTLHLPMTPDAAVAMLACARIGAIHSVVFGGFSPEALAGRIADCGSRLVITADEGVRGSRTVPLKRNVDDSLAILATRNGGGSGPSGHGVDTVLVLRRTGADTPMTPGRDVAYAEAERDVSDDCPAEPMGAEDPLFILYTSGSTGKPKGVLHTTGGYLLWAALDARTRLPPPPGRAVLVHRRRGLGHGPQLRGLRSPGERRRDADVRGACPTTRTPADAGT